MISNDTLCNQAQFTAYHHTLNDNSVECANISYQKVRHLCPSTTFVAFITSSRVALTENLHVKFIL